MGEREALLAAVCANPNDDLPRLVFADWLDENGEPERAEFIRLQVRLAELWANPDRPVEAVGPARPIVAGRDRNEVIRQMAIADVRKRERELWSEYGPRWLEGLFRRKEIEWFTAFHRGFVDRVTVRSDRTLIRHTRVFALEPVRHLTIRRFEGVKGFSAVLWLPRLKTLKIGSHRTSSEAIDELLRCDSFDPKLVLMLSLGNAGSARHEDLQRQFGDRLFQHLLL